MLVLGPGQGARVRARATVARVRATTRAKARASRHLRDRRMELAARVHAPELCAHGLEGGGAARARAAAEEPAHARHRGCFEAATVLAPSPPRCGRGTTCGRGPLCACPHQGSTTARSSAFGLTDSCCRWNQPIDFLGSPQPTTMVRTALISAWHSATAWKDRGESIGWEQGLTADVFALLT